jgi:cobalt-zinc-cadmium resistance protein CzcA
MLNKIIHFSIHNKLVIGIFTLMLVVWGSYSLSTLPIDAVPDITNNQVQVITTSPSLAAQEVERLITFPVETAMATIPNMVEIRSISRFGLSVVTIVFKDNVDVYWARQQVSERLNVAAEQIPKDAGRPDMAPVTTGLGEIYQYVLHTDKGYENKYDAMELRSIQDWIVRKQLLGTAGVADVSSFGGFVKQYEIAVDQQKLKSFGISVADIFTSLENNNQNTGGAYIDKKPNAYFIRTEGLIGGLDDIGNITVRQNANGIPVLIRDVAKVQLGQAVRYGAMTRNDEGEVVGGLVLMLKGANSSEVIKKVKERIEQIRKTLPKGVVVEPFLDRTKLVNNAIGTVSKNLIEGALIVIFVLILLLGNLRAGLVVASVIPLAMLFAVSMMKLFGVSGNLMSLGAIDFGLIVDGAVIIVEATLHHIAGKNYPNRISQQEMDAEVYESASKIRNAAAFGEIIILIVYLPILALVGIEGKMFKPMAQTVSFAILGAFILSLTYVPMISALVLSKRNAQKPNISDKIIASCQRIYMPALRMSLARGWLVLLFSGLMFVISILIFSRMGGEFIPQLDEGDFAVETRVLTGSSLSETVDATQKAAGIIRKNFPDEVIEVVGKIGSSEIPTDPMPVEAADLMIILTDKNKWTKADNREELAEKMQASLNESLAGVTFGFQQPIQMRFNELMTGVKQDVAVKIFGEDLDELAATAKKIGKIVSTVEGAEDVYVEAVSGLPQIVVNFDREALAKFGLSIDDANRTISTAFAGRSTGLVYEGEKRYDLVVRLDKAGRQDLTDVRNLFITTGHGEQIPLNQVAEIEMKNGVNQVQREDTKRRIIVAFNVRGRDVASLVEELQSKIDEKITLPTGYYVTYGGQFQNLREANKRLAIAVPAALLLIFALLYFTFHSLRQSLLILTAIPLSAIGGVLALWMRGMPFSISAGVGFIALFGVAVLNGIVLIAEFNSLRKKGLTDLREIVFQGTSTRLRPVLMTALVASLGFLPMALSGNAGAEVQRPLATVVIGGLISATFLTLFVLPILYVLIEKQLKPGSFKSSLAIIFVVASLIPVRSFSQDMNSSARKVTLEQALQEANEKNPSIKSGSYQIEYQRALLKTATEFQKTEINLMAGQYNSVRFDNHFAVSQKLPNPAVSRKRSALFNEQLAGSESMLQITKAELLREVKLIFYNWLLLHERQKLLVEEEKRTIAFVKAAELRFKTGEANHLEGSTAKSEQGKIQTLIIQNRADLEILQHQLRALIGSAVPVMPDSAIAKRREIKMLLADTSKIAENPRLQYLKQRISIYQKVTAVEKTTLLPDVSLGYFNQSLIGTLNNAGTEIYGASKRFQGFHIGVSVPVFTKATRARISASAIQQRIAENELNAAAITIRSELDQAIRSYQKASESLDFYESTTLILAAEIRSSAQKSYQAGEIGYIAYLQSVDRALTIQNNYLDLVHAYNVALIQIEFLINDDQVK